jgi:hypothetical protein
MARSESMDLCPELIDLNHLGVLYTGKKERLVWRSCLSVCCLWPSISSSTDGQNFYIEKGVLQSNYQKIPILLKIGETQEPCVWRPASCSRFCVHLESTAWMWRHEKSFKQTRTSTSLFQQFLRILGLLLCHLTTSETSDVDNILYWFLHKTVNSFPCLPAHPLTVPLSTA